MTYDIKITVVGETEVGKTSLTQFFVTEQPQLQNATTPCASFLKKVARLGERAVNFQLWDTAGQERFRSIAPMYYRGSDCVLLVYDVACPASFRQIQDFWLREVQQKCQPDAVLALVANKQDLEPKLVPREDAARLAEAYGLHFFETSGRSGLNVGDMFLRLGQLVLEAKQRQRQRLLQQQPAPESRPAALAVEAPAEKPSGCC